MSEAGTARDPLFGVKAAKQIGAIATELVDFLVRWSATFLDGLSATACAKCAVRALLRMPVRRGAHFNGGRFCSEALRQPIPSADAPLHALLVKHAYALL